MSLEAALAANTAAIIGLTEVWGKLAAMGKVIDRKVEAGEQTKTTAGNLEIPLTKVEAPKPVPTPPAAETVAAPAETVTASPSEITYLQVGQAITDMVKVDRPRAIAALAKFGAKKGPDLKPEQWADFLKEIA